MAKKEKNQSVAVVFLGIVAVLAVLGLIWQLSVQNSQTAQSDSLVLEEVNTLTNLGGAAASNCLSRKCKNAWDTRQCFCNNLETCDASGTKYADKYC